MPKQRAAFLEMSRTDISIQSRTDLRIRRTMADGINPKVDDDILVGKGIFPYLYLDDESKL